MSKLDEFARIFRLPPALLPHIDFVAQAREIDLVVGLADQAKTLEQVAEMMQMPQGECEAFLQASYYRQIISRKTEDGVTLYRAGTFYDRLNPLSMYENWKDVPEDARNAVIDWQLDEFITVWQPVVDEIRKDPDAFVRMPNRDVLLLDEALQMVDAASECVVVPCDCRTIVMACNRPVETCVRLDEGARHTLEQGHGRVVTRDELKTIVVNADRSGLMHTGAREWRRQGELFGFCNCCACDCYPFRAGVKLGLHREWPRAHHVADRDAAKCQQCGTCTRRCHFGAFHRDGTTTELNGKKVKATVFDATKCYGCGLCATACPEGAITMRPLEVVVSQAAPVAGAA
jgi:NAD-dependent dihydropyrimidine dehydrogenase PreA subunit